MSAAPKFAPSLAIVVEAAGGFEIVDVVSKAHARTPSGAKFWTPDFESAVERLDELQAAEARGRP